MTMEALMTCTKSYVLCFLGVFFFNFSSGTVVAIALLRYIIALCYCVTTYDVVLLLVCTCLSGISWYRYKSKPSSFHSVWIRCGRQSSYYVQYLSISKMIVR